MDVEKIYDDLIAPHMAEILEISEKHNIPFVCSFQLTSGENDPNGPLYCDCCNINEWCSEDLRYIGQLLYQSATSSDPGLVLTVRDADGQILSQTLTMGAGE